MDDALHGRQANLTLRLGRLEFCRNLTRQRAQINRFAAHLAPRHARQLKQVIYELPQALAGCPYTMQVILALGIQAARILFQQRQAKAIDGSQRCPQVVRDRIGKGFTSRAR